LKRLVQVSLDDQYLSSHNMSSSSPCNWTKGATTTTCTTAATAEQHDQEPQQHKSEDKCTKFLFSYPFGVQIRLILLTNPRERKFRAGCSVSVDEELVASLGVAPTIDPIDEEREEESTKRYKKGAANTASAERQGEEPASSKVTLPPPAPASSARRTTSFKDRVLETLALD